ncbi:MAG TPA: sigma-70 family RNA polymerase sigma factor, partial [Tepidisphaeraceae bacterium]|nr:sigma-70 family RNA polymerase sigma factor [Tepidisphaeraceae bacterium]
PKRVASDLLTGVALQHDLGLLIEQLSESLDVISADLSEPVLSIDDVTDRFSVTSKTIQRWRRRGLPARRFIFSDGKRRVGFLLSSVERFFATHREQVAGTNLSIVADQERDEILRRARLLAKKCGCCSGEITRRIAKRLNRSPLTILHIIRRHDQEHADDPILLFAAVDVQQEVRSRILRAYRRGISIKSLAGRYYLSRSEIYRVIMDERIARLNRRKVKFIDDSLYHQDDAAEMIEQIVSQEEIAKEATREERSTPRDLPPYLQQLYRTPLLTPNRERALFLKFNFHKFQFVQARRKLEPEFARSADLDRLENHLRRAIETKNAILQANLRLVVSVARKHLRPNLNLMELVSDGNITLMRAVEGFDLHRGNRFSTYATLALMKGFARSVPMMQAAARTAAADNSSLSEIADHRQPFVVQRLVQRDQIGQLLSNLNDRERHVILSHYGLNESIPATYEQVAQRLGLSKHRVRQIEQIAIAKLRANAPKD